jgi:hypothetical protein
MRLLHFPWSGRDRVLAGHVAEYDLLGAAVNTA